MWECMKIVPATKRTDQSDFVSFTINTFSQCKIKNFVVESTWLDSTLF